MYLHQLVFFIYFKSSILYRCTIYVEAKLLELKNFLASCFFLCYRVLSPHLSAFRWIYEELKYSKCNKLSSPFILRDFPSFSFY